jgi:zeta-carotene isomerase
MQGYSNTRRWSSEARASVEDSSSSSSSQLAAAVPSSSSQDSGSREKNSATTNEDGGSVGAGALQLLVGEDAAVFDPSNQKTSSWLLFTLILGVSLTALYVLWIDPNTGYGGAFIDAVSSVSSSHEVVILIILFIFALVHSGLASLRREAEKLVGERAYRVLYAVLSLPLAVSAVVYFINHRSDGLQLWQVQTVPGVHELVWVLSFVSFFFLYPSTFNLLEVAAVDKPKMHMWETGIMRITRHPQVLFFCLIVFLVKLVQAYNIDTTICVKFPNFKFLAEYIKSVVGKLNEHILRTLLL